MPARKKPVAPEEKKELAYYLTMFKLEGHETWRAHLGGHKDAFTIEQKNWSGKNVPKVTETRVLRFDRLTGTFKEPK
jgi:hypothetical protein